MCRRFSQSRRIKPPVTLTGFFLTLNAIDRQTFSTLAKLRLVLKRSAETVKLVKNWFYNLSYNLLLLILPLITVPYVSRVIGVAGIGINDYTSALVNYFLLFGTLGIKLYANRELAYHRGEKFTRSQLFWEITCLQALTIGVAILAFMGYWLIASRYRTYLLLQALVLPAAIFDISWYFMGMEDFGKVVLRNAFVRLLAISLIFTLVHSTADLWLYILLNAGSSLIGNLTLWPYLVQQIQWVPRAQLHPLQHLRGSLTLFLPTIAIQIYLSLNRNLLGVFASMSAVGYYGYADRVIRLVLGIVTALGSVMLPNIANKAAHKQYAAIKTSLYRSFDFTTALAVPLVFGLALLGPSFSQWYLGSGYQLTGQLLIAEAPVILFIAWGNVTGIQLLLPLKRNREYTLSVILGAVISVGANLIIIPPFGAYGAVFATVLTEFCVTGAQLHAIRDFISRRRLFHATWKYLLSGSVMYVTLHFLLNYWSATGLTAILLTVLCGTGLYFISLKVVAAPILKELHFFLQKAANHLG